MKISQLVRAGIFLLIVLNMLLAFVCIWAFGRMSPELGRINLRNERSLFACEEMLSALAAGDSPDARVRFASAFERAGGNITEPGEKEAFDELRRISGGGSSAFLPARRTETIQAIRTLSEINRTAMRREAGVIRSFGIAGAWLVVFAALAIFCAGVVFRNMITRNFVDPFMEIRDVLAADAAGDRFRRCSVKSPYSDMAGICENINRLLDSRGRS